MLLQIVQQCNNIHCFLYDSYKRELYADFLIVVRKSCIVKYEFTNHKLLSETFHDVCRKICSFNLIFLKHRIGTNISLDLDDFSWQ